MKRYGKISIFAVLLSAFVLTHICAQPVSASATVNEDSGSQEGWRPEDVRRAVEATPYSALVVHARLRHRRCEANLILKNIRNETQTI